MNKPDTQAVERVRKDLLKLSGATERGDLKTARQLAGHLEESLQMLIEQMNKPDTQAVKRARKDLLKFSTATARGDQEVARQLAGRLEESLEELLDQMRQTRGGS